MTNAGLVHDTMPSDALQSDALDAPEPALPTAAGHDIPDLARVALASAAVVVMFNFRWFIDLTDRNFLATYAEGTASTQLIMLGSGGAMAAALAWLGVERLRPLALWPMLLFVAWSLVTTLLSVDPLLSIRRLVLLYIAAILACGVLVLPRSPRQFALSLLIGTGIILGASYFGIVFLPELAVHNSFDLDAMQEYVGLWRGVFDSKNAASAAMLIVVFSGLYVASALNRVAGWVVVVAALVFLFGSQSKTVLATLPVVLLTVALFELAGRRWLRQTILAVPALFMVLVSLGSLVIPPIKSVLDAVLSDASFTGRAGIWEFALSSIAKRPIHGYGFGAFWGTANTLYASDTEAWAPAAAHAHNGYLDAALAMGVPGLLLVVAIYVLIPLRDAATLAERPGGVDAMTRLFLRCWMFGLLSASFEPVFQNPRATMCYIMFLAIFGLRLRASYRPLA